MTDREKLERLEIVLRTTKSYAYKHYDRKLLKLVNDALRDVYGDDV